MPDEQVGITVCKGPCEQPTLHTTIRPVCRGRLFLQCLACGTVYSIPTPQKAEVS